MNDAEAIALALEEAKSAALRGEVPVGAVLLGQEGVLLAHDGNRILELKDPTAHAEMLVMRAAAKRLNNERLIGATLLCQPGALRDVRRRDGDGAGGAAGVRRLRSQGAARCCMARASSSSRPAITGRQ